MRVRLVAAGLAAVALAGCQDPYANTDPTRPAPKAPVRQQVAARSASEVARAFGQLWINWTWRTASTTQRRLARLAAPALARQLEANARSAQIDAGLARDRPASRGDVATVQLRATGTTAHGLLVTLERTFTAGRADLGGSRYRVYEITEQLRRGTWEVSRWAPQP